MFIVRKISIAFSAILFCMAAFAQRDVFRSGPLTVKSLEEIKNLNGYLKAEETLKYIRSTTTQASKEAYDLITESLSIAKDLQRHDLIGGLLCGKAVLQLQETDTASALKNLQLAENYLQQITDKRFTDNVMNALAIGYMRAGNAAKAVEMNKRLLASYEDIPENRLRRLFAYRNLSNAYLRLQKQTEAADAMETAIKYAWAANNETILIDTKLAASMMYASANDYKRSFTILKDIIPNINKLPSKAAETLYHVLADTYQKQGEYKLANEYYKKLVSSPYQNIVIAAYTQLLLNTDKTNEQDSTDNYYNALSSSAFKNQKTTAAYNLAVAKYFSYKKNTKQEVAFLKKAIAERNSQQSVEAMIGLATYYSENGQKDSADFFFAAALKHKSSIQEDKTLYSEYLSAVHQHQTRYKATDSLISVLNTELKLKDSLQKSSAFTITKDLETRYKVSEKEYQLNQLAQQRKFDQLNLKEQKQQTWIAFLTLAVVLIAFCAAAFILYSKKKQNEKIHSIELTSLKNKHKVELMLALDKAQEKERRSIADKLHDEVGAMLSVLKLNLSGTENQLTHGTDKRLKTSLNIVDSLAGEIRNLSHTLMPVVVEKYGMIRGIKDLTQQINDSGKLKTELLVIGFEEENSIPVHQQMHVYRIVQELMNNIIKHSGATNALIQLVEHDSHLSLVVEDNGKGIVQKDSEGNGLYVLNSKVEILNGEMNVDSQPGNGTSFIIEIPKNTNTPLLYEKNQDNISRRPSGSA